MRVVLKPIEGIALAAVSDSNHWTVMDTSVENGGSGAANTPMELLLAALGGCTSMDVLPMLKKMRVPVERFELVAEADRAENHPRVLTRIHLVYRFWGNELDPKKLEQAVTLSMTNYCSISAMLKPTVPITHAVEIMNPNG
jgi:putative redox protein